MTEEDFIEAMAQDPSDPGPRIVFGDWLMERGDPRGEFFRLDHEVRHGVPTTLVEKRAAKIARRELLRVGAHAFAADGLIDKLAKSYIDFASDTRRLFSLGPIHLLELAGAHGKIATLAQHAPLRWTFGLELGSPQMSTSNAVLLAASPHARRLRRVGIANNAIGAEGAAGFAQLPALVSLDVTQTSLDNVVDWLVPAMPRLHTLAIGRNALDAKAIEALLATAPALTSLDVSHNPLERAGARVLAGASSPLRYLNLDSVGLDDEGLEALASAPNLQTLEALRIQSNRLGPRSADLLMETAHLPALRQLSIYANNQISRTRAHAIMRRFAQPR